MLRLGSSRTAIIAVVLATGLGCPRARAQDSAPVHPGTAGHHRAGTAEANGIRIAYEMDGPLDAEPVLLLMGLGCQLTAWPEPFTRELLDRGFRVIAYDHRDVGLSTKFDQAGVPDVRKLFQAKLLGTPVVAPYTLDDMARDAVGLLDALGIRAAHLVGVSMGGHIAHLIAADDPEHTLSLTSIMSSSLNPALPPPRGDVLAALNMPDRTGDREGFQNDMVRLWGLIASPRYPTDPALIRARAGRDFERCYYPAGAARHFAAIMAAADQRPKLRTIRVPTVVVHGDVDPLVSVQAGRDTAANIPGAELRIIEGMGHDLPLQLAEQLADAVSAAAARARLAATAAGGSQPE